MAGAGPATSWVESRLLLSSGRDVCSSTALPALSAPTVLPKLDADRDADYELIIRESIQCPRLIPALFSSAALGTPHLPTHPPSHGCKVYFLVLPCAEVRVGTGDPAGVASTNWLTSPAQSVWYPWVVGERRSELGQRPLVFVTQPCPCLPARGCNSFSSWSRVIIPISGSGASIKFMEGTQQSYPFPTQRVTVDRGTPSANF